jgi:hypothetical protein
MKKRNVLCKHLILDTGTDTIGWRYKRQQFLLLLTFDIEAEVDSIILMRILHYVAENKDYFIQ